MNENGAEFVGEAQIERVTEVDDETFEFLSKNFKDVAWDRGRLEAFLSSPDNVLLIAKRSNEGAGLLRAHFLHRFDNKGTEILLHEIDVLPAHQKQGVGTSLVEQLKEIAKADGATEIWVITNRSNAGATALYESTGGEAPSDDDVVFVYDLRK